MIDRYGRTHGHVQAYWVGPPESVSRWGSVLTHEALNCRIIQKMNFNNLIDC